MFSHLMSNMLPSSMHYFLVLTVFVLAIANAESKLKVVHGEEVEPHSFPYVVSLRATINGRDIQCGGSLIALNKVLTAAWCVYGAEKVDLILGAHNISFQEDTQVRYESSNFTIHQEYDPVRHTNDIAVVYLPEEVTLTDAIQLISTPTLADILVSYEHELGIVAGWGKYDDNVPAYSDVLRKIEATIISNIACGLPYLFSIQTYQMCTSGVQDRQNICLGDNGSPLVVKGVQVGIASYGFDLGCSIGFPGVYTRLTSFYFWL